MRSTKYKSIAVIILLCLGAFVQLNAQSKDSTEILDWRRGIFPKEKPDEIYNIKINGFYRFFATYLHMPEPYLLNSSGSLTNRNTLFIGDDSQLPNFLVNISGRPSKNVSWGLDLYMFQFLEGRINPAYSGQVPTSQLPPVWDPLSGARLAPSMGLNLGINLYGTYHTKIGTYSIRMGGIHWFSMSDLTLATNRGYNRFSLYERNPWDPIGRDVGFRYNQLYSAGFVQQDIRWGEQAVQGIILQGANLPGNWDFSLLYGKTQLNGGFLTTPNVNYGAKLKNTYHNNDYISINTLNNTTWIDSLNQIPVGFNIVTLEWMANYKYFSIHAEAGPGRYVTPLSDYPWGEAISLKVLSTPLLTKIPLELHYYRISPYVVNNNAVFWNTSIITARIVENPIGPVQSTNVLNPFASSIVGIGQMTNNRTGLSLNTEFNIRKLRVSAGYSVSSEITPFQNRITFSHFVNQLTRSRFWRWDFPLDVGPYGRYDKAYRDAYETVELTDDSLGFAVNTKKFTALEFHGKYKTQIGHKNFFAFLLGRYYTSQSFLSVVPVFSDRAYLRQYSTELEMYYQLTDILFINSYLGFERNIGNYNTALDFESFRPLDQTGWGVGLGMDISLGRNAGLYLRYRWFYFKDENFALDTFKGQETLVELKVFF
jgi:hypothetical protein